MFWILKKFKKETAAEILMLIAAIGYLWKKATGSLRGIFVVSLICYFSSSIIFGTKPYGVSELIAWFSGLDSTYKISVTTSIITILGFLIAFHSANESWKKQIQSQLRLNAATDLEYVYSEISDALINITIYADAILDTVETSQGNLSSEEAKFKVSYNFKKIEEFFNERAKIRQATNLAMRVLCKYVNVLSSVSNTRLQVQSINEQLNNLNPILWPSVPYVNLDDPNYVSNFVSQINVDEWQRLKDQCSTVMEYMNVTSGMVSGLLKSSVTDFNIHSLMDFFRQRESFPDIIDISKGKKLTNNSEDNNRCEQIQKGRDEMVSNKIALKDRIEKFLIKDKGIANIFKNLSWLTVAAAIFKLSLLLISASIAIRVITGLFSFFLFSLAMIWGLKIIIIPLLQVFYGDDEKYSQMARSGWKSFFTFQFLIYLLLSSLYLLLTMIWFDAIAKIKL